MPLPSRKKGEGRKEYVSRCVSFMTRKGEGKDTAQRVAICNSKASELTKEQAAALAKLLTHMKLPPMKKKKKDKYRITKEDGSGTDNTMADCLPCQASLPDSFYGSIELFATASEGKKPPKPLNKPFRTPGGPKKFSVYVRNDRGNIVKVNFGDPNMEIKRDDPGRRKNFRARHNCDSPGPKWKARYWSCRFWERGAPVSKLTRRKSSGQDDNLK